MEKNKFNDSVCETCDRDIYLGQCLCKEGKANLENGSCCPTKSQALFIVWDLYDFLFHFFISGVKVVQ